MNYQTDTPSIFPGSERVQKLLVADDNEDMRRLLSQALEVHGFHVKAVSDGEQAWDALQLEHYDLIVTDNDMPRLAGIKLIERIRDAGMHLPIVVVSGSFALGGAHDYRRLEITAMIPKPFDLWEFLTIVKLSLRGAVRTATARHETLPNASVKVSPLDAPATKRRVLIADDDEFVRGSLAAVLESEGYLAEEASNGMEAVTLAIKNKPDLVLLDLNMPQADGWTAFSQLDQIKPLLPVIIITARPNQYKEAVRVGVDAFMEKPLDISVLMEAVKRLTTEEEGRHINRITNCSFVTELLGAVAV